MTGLLPYLAVAALLGWAALIPGHLRRHPEERLPFALVLGAVLAAWGALAAVGPAGLPRAALLMLREGRDTTTTLHFLLTEEPVFRDWVASAWRLPIRTSVAIHLAEAALAAGLLVLIGWRRGGAAAGAAVAGTAVASAWFVHAASSAGPETTVILGALLPAHAWLMRGSSRGPAVAVLAACVAIVASLRLETLLVGLPALVLALVPSLPRVEAAFARLPRWSRPVLAVLAGELAMAGLWLAFSASGAVRGLSEPAMLPWGARHLDTLRWPVALLAFAPVGFAVLAVTGFVAATVHSPRSWALAAAVLLLERVYNVEEHLGDAPFETLRHHAMSFGLVALLAAAGAETLLRRAGPRATALAALLLATAFLPRPLSPEGVPPVPWRRIETTGTVGTRFVVEVTEAFSRCVILTRVAPTVLRRDGPPHAWTYAFEDRAFGIPLLPGGDVTETREVVRRLTVRGLTEDVPLDLPAAWPRELAHAPCLVWLHGPDCNLNGADCAAWVEGLDPVVDVAVEVAEHNTHHGTHARPLRLAAWYVGRR